MESQRTTYGWVLRLDPGEEIFGCIQRFASERGLGAAMISALGACGEAELGFFDRARSTYVRRTFQGEFEILSLTGNLSVLEGQPLPHCHVLLAGDDFVAHGGHLFRAVVTVTCEVSLVTDPGVLRRDKRPDLGYNPLAPA